MPTEAQMRNKLNGYLGKICSKNYDNLGEPIQLISEAVKRSGFNAEALDGIYCGRDGKAHDQIGQKIWLTMTWHKFETANRWEVNAYAS